MLTVRTGASALALVATLASGLTACGTSNGVGIALPLSTASATNAQPEPPIEQFKPLLRQPIPGLAGKSFTSATVTFPPGAQARPHRHGQAFVFAFVLDGTVRSKVEGQRARTFHQGDYWVESPGAHHLQTQNLSKTEPAKLLVTFVADTNADLKVDDPQN